MFQGRNFGAADLTPSPRNTFLAGRDQVEVYFAPEDHVADEILSLMKQSKESIHFLAYTLTLDDLGQELVDQYRSRRDVRGVFDADMLPGSTGSEYDLLRRAGLDVHLDGNPGLMHEKLIIIDGKIVVIGSFNYTRAADERNDENIMVIYDPALARIFETEFQKVLSNSQP
jgi:phosphatidylserine/phosphatidylglycerophosphate/cardiolipin synthase-like enzyme